MFSFSKFRLPSPSVEDLPFETGISGFLAEGTLVRGEMTLEGVFRLDGDCIGPVQCSQRLIIGPTGRVRGSLLAPEIVVSGLVKGDIWALRKIVIHASAIVLGNIVAPLMSVERGALLEGFFSIKQQSVEEIQQNRLYAQKDYFLFKEEKHHDSSSLWTKTLS